MNRREFWIGFAGMLLLGGLFATAQAQSLDDSAAINKAGRQRMLSQRMVKDYCQVGLNVRREEAQKQLQDAVALFDAQLAELRDYAPNRSLQAAIVQVEGAWGPFRAILLKPYDRNEVRKLVEMSDELLTRTNKVVLLIQDASGQPFLRLVNVSGRQRMLSQRIAKLYMCRQAGVHDAEVLEELEQVKNEFKGALTDLRAAPQNTASINMALDAAGVQWQLLEYSLEHSDKPLEEFVAITSEKILGIMDGVTASYQQLTGG